jgi:hypothetical protein
MRGRHFIWIVGVLAAALGAAALGVHASSAAPARASAAASTFDATYSCRVRKQHYVNLNASVTLPPVDNQPQPGVLLLTTVQKTHTKNGVMITVAQVSFSAKKNTLTIDKSTCSRVKHKIPLKRKGISGPPIVVTPSLYGHDSESCGTAGRVLVRLRLEMKNQAPSHALLAIRNQNAKKRPVAFYNWTPNRVSAYISNSCSAG